MYTQVREEESSPLLCDFTATLFGLMPLAYEDSVNINGLGRNNTLPNFLSCSVLFYAIVEAVEPFKLHPTSMSYIY